MRRLSKCQFVKIQSITVVKEKDGQIFRVSLNAGVGPSLIEIVDHTKGKCLLKFKPNRRVPFKTVHFSITKIGTLAKLPLNIDGSQAKGSVMIISKIERCTKKVRNGHQNGRRHPKK